MSYTGTKSSNRTRSFSLFSRCPSAVPPANQSSAQWTHIEPWTTAQPVTLFDLKHDSLIFDPIELKLRSESIVCLIQCDNDLAASRRLMP